jgi:2-amino-4-hydroxy-6-hydroxymethyldihydropteridine diphosphokinase
MNETLTPIALALGSNLGDRLANLRAAVEAVGGIATVTAVSPVYETPAAYVTDQPAFLNATLTAVTKLSPQALLFALKHSEQEIGRQPTFRYGPRVIDLDILLYGEQTVATVELNIPHPRMAERAFVLRPLADIAPDWLHPTSGKTVAALLADLPPEEFSCLGKLL